MRSRGQPFATALRMARKRRRVTKNVALAALLTLTALVVLCQLGLFTGGNRDEVARGDSLASQTPETRDPSAGPPREEEGRRTSPYQEVDDLDVFTPRPQEGFLSFEAYLDCLAERLSLDLAKRAEMPFPSDNASRAMTIPYLVQPVSIELADVKHFMCSMRAPIRHITYVMDGNAPEMRLFLEAVNAIVAGWTSRLRVQFFPVVVGTPGAVNAGLRHAMSHFGHDEVPFVFVSKPIVRVPAVTMAGLVGSVYNLTSYDKERILQLEREVAAEAKALRQRARPRVLRTGPDGALVGGGNGLLSTSALLPQRVRDLPVDQQREEFADHYAFFYFNVDQGPGSQVSFFVSRLAVLVGGYVDENYYPGGFEDSDLRWRYHQLGFTSFRAAFDAPRATFYDDLLVNFNMNREERDRDDGDGGAPASRWGRATKAKLSPQAELLKQQMRDAFGDGYAFSYAMWKWRVSDPVTLSEEDSPFPPYDDVNPEKPEGAPGMPVDAWVLDTRRQQTIRRKLSKAPIADRKALLYDATLPQKTDFLRSP